MIREDTTDFGPFRGKTQPGRDFTIMIVDDDPLVIYMLENILRHEAYGTVSARMAEQAYEMAQREQPDLILLDVNMPDERGPGICKKLKATIATAEIPVLFLSAETDVRYKIECFDAGGQDYITKPFEPREVLARVRTHLRLQQAQRTLVEMLTRQINDMAKAQQSLLPPEPEQVPAARFCAYYRQLAGAGGDFYDIIKAGDDVYDYVAVDVSGHDIGIALVTAAVKTILVQNCTLLHSPGEILSLTNKIIPSVLQPGQFLCVSWVRINRKSQKATIVNGGQPPVLYMPHNGPVRKIDLTGDIIGAFDQVVFKQQELSVAKGDRFLLYSDGLIEVDGKSPGSRENGIGRLVDSCKQLAGRPLATFVDDLVPVLLGGRTPDDDIVLLGVEV